VFDATVVATLHLNRTLQKPEGALPGNSTAFVWMLWKAASPVRDKIDRIAGVLRATHPDFEYQPLFPPEELGDAGRVRWVSGAPGKPSAYAGTDFIVARNGRIASVYLFFDNLP
jgi:hypothetical protein